MSNRLFALMVVYTMIASGTFNYVNYRLPEKPMIQKLMVSAVWPSFAMTAALHSAFKPTITITNNYSDGVNVKSEKIVE